MDCMFPDEKLEVIGNIKLGSGNEIFFADNGQIRSNDDNHRILFRRADNKMEFREYGDIVFSPGAIAGNETAKVVMKAGGNVDMTGDLNVGGHITDLVESHDGYWASCSGACGFTETDCGTITDRICVLSFVQMHDVDGSDETGTCAVVRDTASGKWLLQAYAGSTDADTYCGATCLNF